MKKKFVIFITLIAIFIFGLTLFYFKYNKSLKINALRPGDFGAIITNVNLVDFDGQELDSIKKGDVVSIKSNYKELLQVSNYNSKTGWIDRKFLIRSSIKIIAERYNESPTNFVEYAFRNVPKQMPNKTSDNEISGCPKITYCSFSSKIYYAYISFCECDGTIPMSTKILNNVDLISNDKVYTSLKIPNCKDAEEAYYLMIFA